MILMASGPDWSSINGSVGITMGVNKPNRVASYSSSALKSNVELKLEYF